MTRLQTYLLWRMLLILPGIMTITAHADEPPILRIDPGGHTAAVHAVVFTPDGQQLISAGRDRIVRIWNLQTGQPRALRYQIGSGRDGELFAAALSPDRAVPRLALGTSAASDGPC